MAKKFTMLGIYVRHDQALFLREQLQKSISEYIRELIDKDISENGIKYKLGVYKQTYENMSVITEIQKTMKERMEHGNDS